jgi:hypothetical protein
MFEKKVNLRAEYRQQEKLLTQESPSLQAKFPELGSLSVNLSHFDSAGSRRASQVKYTLNVERANSRFRFDCANPECVGGDFDLSEPLAGAIAARRETVTGEARCPGWRSKTTVDRLRCDALLRFEFAISYCVEPCVKMVSAG